MGEDRARNLQRLTEDEGQPDIFLPALYTLPSDDQDEGIDCRNASHVAVVVRRVAGGGATLSQFSLAVMVRVGSRWGLARDGLYEGIDTESWAEVFNVRGCDRFRVEAYDPTGIGGVDISYQTYRGA
jgi:hypothetical protein